MNYTGYTFNNKPLAKLSIGCMRFPSRDAAAEVIAECVKHDVLYLDTSPCYLYQSDEENCETWVGAAIQDCRDTVLLSAKCSVGNGGNEVGEYDPARGFSITTADQVRREIEQSLKRLNVDKLDCYQLWAIHAPNLFDEALKPGGWMEGVLKAREEGLFTHLGITGHGDNTEVRRWIDSGLFEMVTIPFHILDITRLDAVQYASEKGVAVIGMNPLVGGMMTDAGPVVAEAMAAFDVESSVEMALRYCASFPGVSALSGMATAEHARENAAIVSKPLWSDEELASITRQMADIFRDAEHVCTTCGYCMPCPQGLLIPEIFKLYNYHRLLKMPNAAREYAGRQGWGDLFRADKCIGCGVCESKCPNSLPVSELMREVMATMGADILE